MKERPILFSAPMVRAILENSKTQTRRIMQPQPDYLAETKGSLFHPAQVDRHGEMYPGEEVFGVYSDDEHWPCPYGRPGDRLWGRETWKPAHSDGSGTFYRATCEDATITGWRPSIHMHRFRSRISLEVVSVRAERLQDISEADAKAEGVSSWIPCGSRLGTLNRTGGGMVETTHLKAYALLWENINGTASWAANPWVWVIEFQKA